MDEGERGRSGYYIFFISFALFLGGCLFLCISSDGVGGKWGPLHKKIYLSLNAFCHGSVLLCHILAFGHPALHHTTILFIQFFWLSHNYVCT